jgi:hypothetical protein
VDNSRALFDRLAQTYPVQGSKIDWESVPGAVVRKCLVYPSHGATELEIKEFMDFYHSIASKFKLDGEAIYIGDGPMELGMLGRLNTMQSALPLIFQVPQHHYLVESDFAWCFSWTMEGDMAFGLKPNSG